MVGSGPSLFHPAILCSSSLLELGWHCHCRYPPPSMLTLNGKSTFQKFFYDMIVLTNKTIGFDIIFSPFKAFLFIMYCPNKISEQT